jgi:hypothetical protein
MPDQPIEMHFPVGGMDVARAVWDQRPRPLPQVEWDRTGEPTLTPGVGLTEQPANVYGRTCARGINVRGYDATLQSRRGGSRPGLSRLVNNQAVANYLIQNLTCFTVAPTSSTTLPDGNTQR